MKQFSIGGLEVIEKGASEICRSPFGQSEIYFHVADANNSHYIFKGDIGNAGWSFEILPVDHLSENLNIQDLQWCRKWYREHSANLSTEEYRKNTLVLNKADFNLMFAMLRYNGKDGDAICSVCGKKVDDWYYAHGYMCSDCAKGQDEFSYKY